MPHRAPAMPTRPDLPPTRALVWLYCPAAQRPAFAALCAIEEQVTTSINLRLDHQLAHARLGWWREECARAAEGNPTHPLTQALAASFSACGLTVPAGISGFVDTATWDLAAATFETPAQLSAYCQRWADAMVTPLIELAAGAPAREALTSAALAPGRRLGAALREIDLLANLAGDAARGRVRVTLTDLAAAHTLPEQLAQPPWPEPLAAWLRTRLQLLRAELAAGVGGLPRQLQPALRGVLVWARLAAAQSLRCERALPCALDTRDHHRPLDSWWAWNAARRAATGRFALAGESRA
jgi:15-cis-phytoene synthase